MNSLVQWDQVLKEKREVFESWFQREFFERTKRVGSTTEDDGKKLENQFRYIDVFIVDSIKNHGGTEKTTIKKNTIVEKITVLITTF